MSYQQLLEDLQTNREIEGEKNGIFVPIPLEVF